VGAAENQEIYQLKVTLVGISPQIWRRSQVAGDCTLAQLHRVCKSPWAGRTTICICFGSAARPTDLLTRTSMVD